MTKIALVLAILCLLSSAAKSADSSEVASQLGTIIGSEKACSLTLDQGAIQRFINRRVMDTDLDFPSTLAIMTGGTEYQIRNMSESALTAHCTQIRRLVQRYGLSAK